MCGPPTVPKAVVDHVVAVISLGRAIRLGTLHYIEVDRYSENAERQSFQLESVYAYVEFRHRDSLARRGVCMATPAFARKFDVSLKLLSAQALTFRCGIYFLNDHRNSFIPSTDSFSVKFWALTTVGGNDHLQ